MKKTIVLTSLLASAVIANAGDVTLTNVAVSDPLLGLSTNVGDLAAGQSITVTVAATISSDLTNTVSVTGVPPTGIPVGGTVPTSKEFSPWHVSKENAVPESHVAAGVQSPREISVPSHETATPPAAA